MRRVAAHQEYKRKKSSPWQSLRPSPKAVRKRTAAAEMETRKATIQTVAVGGGLDLQNRTETAGPPRTSQLAQGLVSLQ